MWTLADARLPIQAINALKKTGDLVLLQTHGITYEAISGHPDIFYCHSPKGVVAAPNAPESITRIVQGTGHLLALGETMVGETYPDTASYNAYIGDSLIVHKTSITDGAIMNRFGHLSIIDVGQGYTRCNLLEVKGCYITSDRGIERKLKKAGLKTFFVNPRQIILPGAPHGFFGGCATFCQNTLYLIGSTAYMQEGEAFLSLMEELDTTLTELYPGPLFDGGSLLMLP